VTGEWLTYAQIGERFGLKAEAARTRVRRLGWRTQPGNDGRTLALMPEDADLRPGGAHAVQPDDDRGGEEDDDRAVTAMLTGLLTEATARADRAEERAQEANGRADAALALADRTLTQLTDAGQRADRAEAARQSADALIANLEADMRAKDAELVQQRILTEQARQQASEQEQAAQEALQATHELRRAEEARKARGRLWRVWDGWRGK
jgi:hypothetical protein